MSAMIWAMAAHAKCMRKKVRISTKVHDRIPRGLAALILIGLVMLPTSWLLGESGFVAQVPLARSAALPNGLQMTVDAMWVEGPGYRPIQIEITTQPPTPSITNRQLLVEITSDEPKHKTTVAGVLEIAQGATTASITLSVPQDFAFSELLVDVFEDGELLEDLSVSGQQQPRFSRNKQPVVLMIDRDAPTRQQRLQRRLNPQPASPQWQGQKLPDFVSVVAPTAPTRPVFGGAGAAYQQINDAFILYQVDNSEFVSLRPPSDLPERWIDFTCFDIAILSLGDLTLMQQKHPNQWQALRRWVATGSTLCVYGIGNRYAQLAELESLLEMPPVDDVKADAITRGWSERPLREEGRIAKTPFVRRRLDLGLVTAFTGDEPFSRRQSSNWRTLLSTIEQDRWYWRDRHGVALNYHNEDFWNFMIPGVGWPPVNMFRFLITVFVVVIGPVNYFLLQRWRRLHLLLITIPAGAALVALSLIVYALVADGLGVRLRVRSYTWIDQPRQQAACWSRQSYYAGLLPSSGLEFPTDTAVFSVSPRAERHFGGRQKLRTLRWDGQRQSLTRGYLNTRTSSQFLVVRSRRNQARLKVVETDNAQVPLQVENLLRTKIHYLLLADSKGQTYWSTDIDQGELAEPRPRPVSKALIELRTVLDENRPRVPKVTYTGFIRPKYYNDELAATFSTSVLERRIHAAVEPGRELKPRTYVAFVESSIDVPVGTQSAKEEAGFHVIEGRW